MKRHLLLGFAAVTTIATLPVMTPAAFAAEETYKIELREISQPADNSGLVKALGFGRDRGRSEWAVITVINKKKVKIRHATRISDTIGVSRWFDHKVTHVRMCGGAYFDMNDAKEDCKIYKGDTVKLPKGKTIHDVSFDFKFTEGGIPYTRVVQISPEFPREDD